MISQISMFKKRKNFNMLLLCYFEENYSLHKFIHIFIVVKSPFHRLQLTHSKIMTFTRPILPVPCDYCSTLAEINLNNVK